MPPSPFPGTPAPASRGPCHVPAFKTPHRPHTPRNTPKSKLIPKPHGPLFGSILSHEKGKTNYVLHIYHSSLSQNVAPKLWTLPLGNLFYRHTHTQSNRFRCNNTTYIQHAINHCALQNKPIKTTGLPSKIKLVA